MTYCNISENILFFAFRYALGRRTGAVSEVTDMLMRNVAKLTPETREQIIREIEGQHRLGGLGDACDAQIWQEVAETLTKGGDSG